MKISRKLFTLLISISLFSTSLFAFDSGWILNMRANVGGSLTTPFISDADLNRLTANKMEGMTSFIGAGTAEVGYIFDNVTYFNLPKDNVFSGMGLFGRVGISQGYSGQISGTEVDGQQIDMFVNVYYTPIITLGASTKAYFFDNRLAVGVGLGAKMIADTAPRYEYYSTDPNAVRAQVGTLIVDDWMKKIMNPFMVSTDIFAEYNVKILPTTELILGGYIGYDIYKPKYITMPDEILKLLDGNSDKIFGHPFDRTKPMDSYFINAFNFGLTFALGFRL